MKEYRIHVDNGMPFGMVYEMSTGVLIVEIWEPYQIELYASVADLKQRHPDYELAPERKLVAYPSQALDQLDQARQKLKDLYQALDLSEDLTPQAAQDLALQEIKRVDDLEREIGTPDAKALCAFVRRLMEKESSAKSDFGKATELVKELRQRLDIAHGTLATVRQGYNKAIDRLTELERELGVDAPDGMEERPFNEAKEAIDDLTHQVAHLNTEELRAREQLKEAEAARSSAVRDLEAMRKERNEATTREQRWQDNADTNRKIANDRYAILERLCNAIGIDAKEHILDDPSMAEHIFSRIVALRDAGDRWANEWNAKRNKEVELHKALGLGPSDEHDVAVRRAKELRQQVEELKEQADTAIQLVRDTAPGTNDLTWKQQYDIARERYESDEKHIADIRDALGVTATPENAYNMRGVTLKQIAMLKERIDGYNRPMTRLKGLYDHLGIDWNDFEPAQQKAIKRIEELKAKSSLLDQIKGTLS